MAYYQAQSEEEELEFIENFPDKIKYLENPSEKLNGQRWKIMLCVFGLLRTRVLK